MSLSKLCVINSSPWNCDVSVMTSWLAQKAAQKLRSKKSRRNSVHVFWGFLQGKRNCLCYYGLNFLPRSNHAQTPNLWNTPPEITMATLRMDLLFFLAQNRAQTPNLWNTPPEITTATFRMECTRLGLHCKRAFRDPTIIIIVTECIVCVPGHDLLTFLSVILFWLGQSFMALTHEVSKHARLAHRVLFFPSVPAEAGRRFWAAACMGTHVSDSGQSL